MADTAALVVPLTAAEDERAQAEALAHRYHAEFVDLKNFKIQHDLLKTVPVELMFRHNFVPIEQQGDALVIAVSDPSRLMILDEIAGLLGHRINIVVDGGAGLHRCWGKRYCAGHMTFFLRVTAEILRRGIRRWRRQRNYTSTLKMPPPISVTSGGTSR